MRVTLIKPAIGRRTEEEYIDEGRMEPLMLGVLASLTPPDVEVLMYDDRMEDVPFDEPTDLAAITVEIYTARRSYEIAAEYRKRGVPVIMGGMHATLVPVRSSSTRRLHLHGRCGDHVGSSGRRRATRRASASLPW